VLERIFARFASITAHWAGTPWAFALAALTIIAWAASGPFFDYSDFWQLTINTGTTIVTFLMVFLIQNSQNRDTRALQIKMDEMIRATEGASNVLMNLEDMSESEMNRLHERYCALAERARELGVDIDWDKDEGGRPTSTPRIASVKKHHEPAEGGKPKRPARKRASPPRKQEQPGEA
jgi:low affinity Fe/Cu permease